MTARPPLDMDALYAEVQQRILTLAPGEVWWRDHYDWLVEEGYTLRRRYHPGWKPSWVGTNRKPRSCEDYRGLLSPLLLDGTRNKDGVHVKFKLIDMDVDPHEVDIATFLASEPLASDPQNHCVPVFEVLKPPEERNRVLIVMPLLLRHNAVPFDTFGEVIHFFRQLFEGMCFMHKHGIAHRDPMTMNIMMDAEAIFHSPWHPLAFWKKRDYSGTHQPYTRTQCKKPIKYYFIDFGISLRFDVDDPNPTAQPRLSGDETAPEFVAGAEGDQEWLGLNTPYNPFPTDVYYLGNFIRRDFLKGTRLTKAKRGFEFIQPLINVMVQDDPAKRPTMDDVLKRFDGIVAGLTTWKLRSRIVEVDETLFSTLTKGAAHWKRRIGYIAHHISPIPK